MGLAIAIGTPGNPPPLPKSRIPLRLEDLRRLERLRDVVVDIRFGFRPDEVDFLVPGQKLALVDLDHEARRKCIRKIEMAAGVTPEMRLACPSETGLTKLSFSTISRDNPGKR